jgi:hypothetical protein
MSSTEDKLSEMVQLTVPVSLDNLAWAIAGLSSLDEEALLAFVVALDERVQTWAFTASVAQRFNEMLKANDDPAEEFIATLARLDRLGPEGDAAREELPTTSSIIARAVHLVTSARD